MSPKMQRRDFITGITGSAAAWPLVARGQQPGQVRRIGILMPYPKSDAESQSYVRAFRQELARLGWSEGGNVQFDERWSTGNMDLVRADAVNLVALNPDVIVIVGDRVIPILTKLTRSIAIVVALTSDPIASGAVEVRAAGPQRDWIFAHRVLDLRKDAGDIEEACSGHLPRRHDV